MGASMLPLEARFNLNRRAKAWSCPIIMPLMFAYIIGSGAMANPEMGR